MIRFVCECGKQLQAREVNAGKSVRCPACQRPLKVPAAPPDPAAIQPEEPSSRPSAEPRIRKKRVAVPDEPEWETDESEEEIEDRPSRRSARSSRKATFSLVFGILSLFCNVFAGLPGLILGILALREIGRSRRRMSGQGLAIAGIVCACLGTLISCGIAVPLGILLPAVQKVRQAADRTQTMNNLKQMGLALHNYNDTYTRLPPPGIGDPAQQVQPAKPLLSWRVALLPYMEQQQLYRQFKLDEPWDSPHNIRLLPQMPKVYAIPGDTQTPSGETHYQVFVGNGAAFDPTRFLSIPRDFRDGISNTLLVVEAARSVPWTKPEDIAFDPGQPIAPLLKASPRGYNILFGDGSVKMVPASTPDNTLKAMITREGGERIALP